MLNNIAVQYKPNVYNQYKISNASVSEPTGMKTQAPQISFSGQLTAFTPAQAVSSNAIRTSLAGKEETKMYNKISEMLDKKGKKDLQELLKNGKLLSNDSNDSTTTLENIYKIATKDRIVALNQEKIVRDVVERIKNPFIITQKFGDIPVQLQNDIINAEKQSGNDISARDLDVRSSTCPAASLEFDLADKNPAEFARFAEGLTSDKMNVERKIDINKLSQGFVGSIWMLNEFNTKHKMENKNTLSVTFEPDRNAIVRARVQTTYQDSDERSPVDVLLQSTFMNTGSQKTYNSLTDKRIPKYNEDDSGLIDIEKNFVEELVTGKGKVCVTYQRLDDTGKLIGYECEQNETFDHIKKTLDGGDNVIIGYTYCDNENNVIGGHEITIIGIEKDRKGNQYFVCNDTDDGLSEPIKYPVNELLPKIHHAGIPKNVLVNNVEFVEGWKELFQIYKETKQQQELEQARQALNNAAYSPVMQPVYPVYTNAA